MSRITQSIASGALKLIAMLPLRILYGISDIMFLLVFYIIRYRRGLVARNLAICFPEKSPAELHRIERKFYRNLADYAVETLKLGHISDNEMRRRMVFENPEMIDSLFAQGRSIAVYFSHCGNWEWAPSVTLWSAYHDDNNVDFCQVYRPLENEFFNRWFLKLRSRFGSISIAKREVFRDLLRIKRSGHLSITGFMSDQKPSHLDPAHIVEFLNRPTDVITGTETLARRTDMAVVYWDMYKERRGHYRIVTRMISEHPSKEPEFAITHRYMSLLEETIRRNPSIWLWTHNRWKKVEHVKK